MDIGAGMGVAMEGGLLEWGDGEGAFRLLSGLTAGDEDARVLADGCVAMGKRLGVTRVPPSRGRASPPTIRACSRVPAPPTSPARRAPITPPATPFPVRQSNI